jgi:Tfp pilus assembly protein PilO
MFTVARPSLTRLNYAAHAVGLAVALSGAVMWGSAVEAISGYRAELARARDEAESVARDDAATQARRAELSDRLAKSRRSNAELRARLMPAAGETKFLVQLTDAATAAKVAIGGVHPGQKTLRDGLGQLQVNLHAEGSFAAVATFLDEIRKLPRACYVSSLKISAEQPGSLRSDLGLHLLFGRSAGEARP